MDMASFHRLRTAVQQNARPAGDAPVAAMERTLEELLQGSALFADVEVGRTGDPDQLVIGVCRCAEQVLPWEAGMGLERLWRTACAGTRWEAHHVGCTESLMEFEGAVTFDDAGHYLTVHIVAEPSTPVETADADQTDTAAAPGVVQQA